MYVFTSQILYKVYKMKDCDQMIDNGRLNVTVLLLHFFRRAAALNGMACISKILPAKSFDYTLSNIIRLYTKAFDYILSNYLFI